MCENPITNVDLAIILYYLWTFVWMVIVYAIYINMLNKPPETEYFSSQEMVNLLNTSAYVVYLEGSCAMFP